MNANVNLAATVGALALLGTGFLLFLAALVLIQSLIARKRARARVVLAAMLLIAGAYAAAILVFSFASHEKILARGEEKHFCELDCHLAYSIANVTEARTLSGAPNQAPAQGVYTIVTLKTRFDETTIAPWRGNGLLNPNSRVLTLIDDRGNRYGPTIQTGTPLATPLRPGESYTTEVAFDLPADAKPATLLVNEAAWETHLVIGHENSPLHKRVKFQLLESSGFHEGLRRRSYRSGFGGLAGIALTRRAPLARSPGRSEKFSRTIHSHHRNICEAHAGRLRSS